MACTGRTRNSNAVELRVSALFAAHPDALQQMIEANFVVNGNGGIGLRGVEAEMAVRVFYAAASRMGNIRIVRDHQNSGTGVVHSGKNIDAKNFVGFVEIDGGLVG